jgi:hypothetical protein
MTTTVEGVEPGNSMRRPPDEDHSQTPLHHGSVEVCRSCLLTVMVGDVPPMPG